MVVKVFLSFELNVSPYCDARIGILLTFKFHLALPGLWIGLAIALFFGALITVTIVLRTDWDREVIIAAERLNDDEENGDRREEAEA